MIDFIIFTISKCAYFSNIFLSFGNSIFSIGKTSFSPANVSQGDCNSNLRNS